MSLILKYDLGNPHRLPVGYTPLAYIESNGTQYIDTNITMNNTVKVYCKMQAITTGGLFYGTGNGGSTSLTAWAANSGMNWRYGGLAATPIPTIKSTEVCEILHSSSRVSVNGTNFTYSGTPLFDSWHIYIFDSPNDSSTASAVRCYFFKIWKDNVLVTDFIPAKNSSGVVGLFDCVSQTFFTNSGTGTFIAGPEVIVLPYEYQQVEYIEGEGTQWTKLNYTVTNSDKVEYTIAYTKFKSDDYLWFVGNRQASVNWLSGARASNVECFWSSSTSYVNGASLVLNKVITNSVDFSAGKFYYTGGNNSFSTISPSPNGMYVFIGNSSPGASATTCTPCKCYNLKVYTGNNIVVHLIPCYRRSDLKPGMYDTVNNVFYTNSGSGEFILGPVVEESSRLLEYNNAGSNYIGIPQNIHHSTSNPSSTLINLGSGDFNGSSSYIQSNSNIGFSGDPNISISAWVKCTDSTWNTDYVGIVGGTTYATGLNWFLMLKSGRPDFDFWSCRVIASNAISLNQWHHIVVTKSPGALSTSTVKIYVDGVAVNTAAESARVPTIVNTPVQIGRANSAGRFFHGCISDVRIYNNVLTVDEVLKIYKGGL